MSGGVATLALPTQITGNANLSGGLTATTGAFSSTLTAPTPTTSDNTTKVATTAFVKGQSYLIANQTITLSGDVTGSGATAITATLASSGVTAGTYTKVTVDAKGRTITGASLASSDVTTALGYTPATAQQPANNYGRNRLRNGRLLVNQRGTTFSTSGAYWSDGWQVTSSTGTITGSVAAGGAAYSYSYALTASVSALPVNGTITIAHKIESLDALDLAAQNVTLSFYAAASTSAGAFAVTVAAYTASSANTFTSNTIIGTATAVAITGTAARYSVTFSNLPAATLNGLQFSFVLTQSSAVGNASFVLGGVQLEVGTAATTLEHLPMQHELTENQRYFQTGQIVYSGYAGAASGTVATTASLPTPMRATPTLASTATSNANLGTVTLASLSNQAAISGSATASAVGSFTMNVTFSASAEL